MAEPGPKCPVCGSTLPSVEGLCPVCVAKNMAALLDNGGPRENIVPGHELGAPLGRGGMGEVFRARRIADGREVAVKIAASGTASNPALMERLAREAAALKALDHPNILRVLESGTLADGRFFLVTELAAGGNLAQRIKAGPLPPAEVARLFREILQAVIAAHRAGILHRDLKPANVLLASDGRALLADFSLARLPDATPGLSLTGGDVFGTPYYLAPEARAGSSHTDERSEIFSLGALLHEMLTGRVPIGQYVPASKVTRVPPAMDRLIARCLAEAPDQRPPDAATLLQEFERAFANDRSRRRRMFAALLLAAGPIIAYVFIILLYYAQPRPPASATAFAPVATNVQPSALSPPNSTHPWVNSLGMRFVSAGSSNILFSIWETRRRDFEEFAKEATPRIASFGARWRQPLGDSNSNCPVSFIDLPTAHDFCEWLTRRERTGGIIGSNDLYRLPTDPEWSQAAGLPNEPGQTPEARETAMRERRGYYAWGRGWPPPDTGIPANFAGAEALAIGTSTELRQRDNWPYLAPVGSFPPNEFGLYDMSGNIAEWCNSTWNRESDDKVLRGGAWNQSSPAALNLITRQHALPVLLAPGSGFRIVLEVAH